MTLLKRILVEKRPILIPLAAVLVVNVLVYALVVYPKGRQEAATVDRANAAAASRQSAEREVSAARALVEGKTRAAQELATFYHDVLPADLTAARRMTYDTLPALAKKTNVTWAERHTDVDTAAQKEERLGRLKIRMLLQGDYENLRRFIYELESAPEFVIIDDVTLSQSDPTKPLTLTLELSAYYRLGANGL
ncbi:MAG TPA: GspMb/PilO family protein [Vicinamibacterales bacterium]|nr:GspMb/PilO family protein [Vicinamibacterales bacterium]